MLFLLHAFSHPPLFRLVLVLLLLLLWHAHGSNN
jgi:hypothetical protein